MAGKGVTVFVTTHYMDEAEYCDRLALINQGRIVALGTPAELKTQYMPEAVWELETDHLVDSLQALKESQRFSEVAVFGNALHVVARKGEDLSSFLPSILAGEGIPPKRLEQIEPSLEDVFVSLIEAEDQENGGKN
jgi:ABC-2 type transport system ATP-binding protein